MRDLFLLGLFPILVFYAIKRPFIGLALWLWTSLVPMQTWAFGIALELRWNLVFAVSTILGYIIMKDKPKVTFTGVFWLVTLLLAIATISSVFHQGFGPLVWDRYERYVKVYIFFVFVYLIVDKRIHFEALAWACVLSVTASAAKQGIKVVTSGGGHVVYGLSSTFGDNNLSAFATLMCIPLTIVLISYHKDKPLLKLGLMGAIAVSVIFVLGSDSRGGLLGLLTLSFFFFINSKYKLPLFVMGIAVAAVGLSLMDASWFERMGTIKTANEDESFMGRIIAWKLSILMAFQSPLWGGGFDAVAYKPTWLGLLSNWDAVSFIPSPYPKIGHVAHSIYFQVLGDLGFLGFFVFFSIIISTYRSFAKLTIAGRSDEWVIQLAVFCKLAIICFLVAGGALSVAYNEIIFMLIAVGSKFKLLYDQPIDRPMVGRTSPAVNMNNQPIDKTQVSLSATQSRLR